MPITLRVPKINDLIVYCGKVEENVAPIWVPKSKPRFICLLWGEAEVRVALYPLGTQKETKTLSVYFWESGDVSRPNDDEVIGQCDLIVERASRAISFAQTRYRTRRRRSLLTQNSKFKIQNS